MHQAGAVVDGHVIGAANAPAVFGIVDAGDAEQRFIAAPEQVATAMLCEDGVLAVQRREPRARQQQALVALLHRHVFEVFTHHQRDIRRQGPGRGGPGEIAKTGIAAVTEAHIDAGVGHFLVTEAHLV